MDKSTTVSTPTTETTSTTVTSSPSSETKVKVVTPDNCVDNKEFRRDPECPGKDCKFAQYSFIQFKKA